MNLKYKKTLLFIFLCTMGIGIITLSMVPSSRNTKITMKQASENVALTVAAQSSETTPLAVSASPTITATPTPTPSPTPTPLPVYDLEEDGYPEIETLIKNYYAAKLSTNSDAMKELLSNPDKVPTLEQMKEDILYIEEYRNIKSYVKKGFEQGSYIVYSFHEIKFLNIDTSAPAVDKFYLLTDTDGKIKIFSDNRDDITDEYYKARDKDDDVIKLLEDTEKKSDEAKESDEYLKVFWNDLAEKLKETDQQ